jgi:HSP20 family protein
MFWTTPYTTLQQMSRMLDELNRTWGESDAATAYPRLNAYTNDEGLLLTMEVPGIDPASIDVTVQDNVLTIAGNFPARERREGESYHRSERRTGKFERRLTLPYRVHADQVKAECRRGVLAVVLPKPEEEKPRKIAVRAA